MMKTRTVSSKSAYDMTGSVLPSEPKKLNFCKILMGIAFLIYLFCALYLVFFERLIYGSSSQFHSAVLEDMPYWQAVKLSIQYKPFHTIQYYTGWLQRSNPLFPIAVMNLAGNLALFFPMGIFLPYFFKKQRNLFWFSMTMTCMIGCVEIIQALTLLGKCDIDDFILNFISAIIGFICFQIWHFLRKRVIYARFKKN